MSRKHASATYFSRPIYKHHWLVPSAAAAASIAVVAVPVVLQSVVVLERWHKRQCPHHTV